MTKTKLSAAAQPPGGPIACLDPAALYRAPSGRLCRLFGMDKRTAPGDSVALLAYVRQDWSKPFARTFEDGFPLTRENWRILQRVY